MKTFIVLLALFAVCMAQVHVDVDPVSKIRTVSKSIETRALPTVNHEEEIQQDEAERKNINSELPVRFGKPIDVSFSLKNSGTWEQLEDGKLWRLRIVSKGAFSTNLIFKRFVVPYGATVHVISESATLGAFTSENNKEDGVFATGPLAGDVFTIEYYEPKEVEGQGELEVEKVVHAYKNFFGLQEKNGRSGTCNINVVCPEGKEWKDQIQATAALMTSSGSRFCSGSMINNRKNDGKQYFLSAFHCGTPSSSWVVLFNYFSSTCARGGSRLLNSTASGVKLIAGNRVSDFTLSEVVEKIPKAYNVYLEGFNAQDKPTQKSVGIHHPAGDVKAISFSDMPVTSSRWASGPDNTHWRVPRWSKGTTEPGSSGSPLFDEQKRVVGQLHGGSASCRNMNGYDVYGKLSHSWEGTSATMRLKDHLDPENTGDRTKSGKYLYDLIKDTKPTECEVCQRSCKFVKSTKCQQFCAQVCSLEQSL
jgi:lysyl endopeptidase